MTRWLPARRTLLNAAIISSLCLAGCDPIVTIAGANFPSWLLCMLVGAALAGLLRPLLALSGLEPYVGPLTIFYPSLIALIAMTVWVAFFNRM